MGRVLTNNIGLSVAKEVPGSLGVLPGSPDWKQLEPNDISTLGAEISTVARNPISPLRQRRKGTITDLDSSAEYEGDLTMDIVDDFIEGFLFVVATNSDTLFTGSTTTTSAYTVPALSAATAAKVFGTTGAKTLFYARGYVNSENNGMKTISTDAAATDTTIEVDQVLVAETPPEGAVVELAGVRAEASDLVLTVTGTNGVLASTNLDFTTLGLTVGQFVHVGGVETAEQFAGDVFGFARVTSIAVNALGLDKLGSGLVTAAGAGDTVDLLFGRFIRNVATTSAEYVEQSFQFEVTYPNLGTGVNAGNPGYEYAEGNFANELAFNVPLTDKATVSVGFIGTDTPPPVFAQRLGADTPRLPVKTAAVNTTSDIGRLRVTEVDETGLTTDFKDMTITLNNNVSPEKVLGTLGAKFMNTGNFEVDIETQVLFTEAEVICAIRENRTVSFDNIFINDDGALALDIPSMTLGGGDREFPVNESVLANLTGQAFVDAALGYSLGVSLLPIVPNPSADIC